MLSCFTLLYYISLHQSISYFIKSNCMIKKYIQDKVDKMIQYNSTAIVTSTSSTILCTFIARTSTVRTHHAPQSNVRTNSSSVKASNLAASICTFCLFNTSINFICFLKALIKSSLCRNNNFTRSSDASNFVRSMHYHRVL